MKCPNCQTENPDLAKFCKGCGSKLEAPAMPITPLAQNPTLSCKSCGATLKPGAKFCAKCGTNVVVAPAGKPAPSQNAPQVAPVVPQAAPVAPQIPPAPKAPDRIVSPPKKKDTPVVLIVVCVLIVIGAVAAAVLFKLDSSNTSQPKDSTTADDSTTESTEETDPTDEEEGLSSEEIARIIAPVDALRDEGISLIENDNLSDGVSKLTTAMEQYVSVVATYGVYPELTVNIDSSYSAYSTGVMNHINVLDSQPLSGAIYEQMTIELNTAISLADELNAAGCSVNCDILKNKLNELPTDYKERYITTFNEFTERETWSRSECWGLMEHVPSSGLYDTNDLDDPLRLRYAFALSMITRKTNETGIADGKLSPYDAATDILNNIAEMDYNPLLISDAAGYYKNAGENETAKRLQNICNEMYKIIQTNEGINIPKDIAPDRFWYFNDFVNYSVDPSNGLSAETRQQLRDYAENALANL